MCPIKIKMIIKKKKDAACFENTRRISGSFELDFLLDEALIRGKYA